MNSIEPKRIFIVEDCLDIQALLAHLLESSGYKVECAANGREALERLKTPGKAPHLILLDMMMPDIDGYAFRKEQQKDPVLRAIPTVIMTAGTEQLSRRSELAVQGYLKKPFTDIDTILGTIERLV